MISAYSPLRGYPILVTAGQSEDRVLARWRFRRAQLITATAGFSALVLILTAILNHYMRELRTRERDYNTLVDSARFGVFLLEGDRFVDANRTAAVMFGLENERAAIGLTPWELSPDLQPNGRPSEELARERILTAAREGGITFEWTHKRADDGKSFPAEVDLSSLSTEGTTLALALVHDVTARKRAEEELRQVTGELLRLQDEERRRIGRDLHDSTGQSLAALEIDLALLAREAAKLSPEGREQLEQCERLARQCSVEIRTASYLLHPPLLDELGLSSALRWLADGLQGAQRARSQIAAARAVAGGRARGGARPLPGGAGGTDQRAAPFLEPLGRDAAAGRARESGARDRGCRAGMPAARNQRSGVLRTVCRSRCRGHA